MIRRILTLFKRRNRARRFGFSFERAAGFVPPREIRIAGERVTLSLPKDGGSAAAFVDVLLDDCYGLVGLPNEIKTVLDAGCHAGLFALAARDRWPNSLIHAYEPNPALRSHWESHAKQASFTVFPEALGAENGAVEIVDHADSVQARTAAALSGGVTQTAFREAVKRLGGTVDVVKLDCEGAERDLFRDAEAWRQVRFLTMEFHLWAGYTLNELRSMLSRLGFRIGHCEMKGPDFGIIRARK